jgi:hypothetical protein
LVVWLLGLLRSFVDWLVVWLLGLLRSLLGMFRYLQRIPFLRVLIHMAAAKPLIS